MTRQRGIDPAHPEAAAEQAGTFTGVAGGSLGTAANLEDTQVFDLDDLRAVEPARPEPAYAPVVAAALATEPARAQVPAPASDPVVSAPVQRVRRSRRPLSGGAFAAAVLVAVVGGAALLALAGGVPRTGMQPGADAPTAAPTAAPVTEAPNDGGGGGGNDGNGRDKDKGGGNGKDKGNGGGNGNGN